jgi:hypothetical protein
VHLAVALVEQTMGEYHFGGYGGACPVLIDSNQLKQELQLLNDPANYEARVKNIHDTMKRLFVFDSHAAERLSRKITQFKDQHL